MAEREGWAAGEGGVEGSDRAAYVHERRAGKRGRDGNICDVASPALIVYTGGGGRSETVAKSAFVVPTCSLIRRTFGSIKRGVVRGASFGLSLILQASRIRRKGQ